MLHVGQRPPSCDGRTKKGQLTICFDPDSLAGKQVIVHFAIYLLTKLTIRKNVVAAVSWPKGQRPEMDCRFDETKSCA